jgi:hypothetical protein
LRYLYHLRGRPVSQYGTDGRARGINGGMFLAYADQCLLPKLELTVIDNLQTHKATGMEEVIKCVGGDASLLAEVFADLNLIDLRYRKFKTLPRKVAARTVSHLLRSTGRIRAEIELCCRFLIRILRETTRPPNRRF